jgi:hypothetical protein
MAKVTVMFGSSAEAEYNLDKPEMKIGRAADCDIVVDNLGVSRHHCSIVKEGDGFVAVDGGSNNGTFVGGQKITRHLLKAGDRIVLGKHSLVFDPSGSAAAGAQGKKKGPAGMGGEMTMFVDQAALAKAMATDGKRMAIALVQGGREVLVNLIKDETTIGKQGDIPVQGLLVKPVQARLQRGSVGHKLVAAGGWRSVRVNGQKITSHDLKPGDVIVIAGSTMTYRSA